MGGRGGSGNRAAAIVQVPVVDADALAEMDIRDAYQDAIDAVGPIRREMMVNPANADVRQQHGPWISIQRLRTALSTRGWDRERVDHHLRRLMRARKIILIPEANQKMMTPEFRRSAVHIGGEDKHVISIKDWGR